MQRQLSDLAVALAEAQSIRRGTDMVDGAAHREVQAQLAMARVSSAVDARSMENYIVFWSFAQSEDLALDLESVGI